MKRVSWRLQVCAHYIFTWLHIWSLERAARSGVAYQLPTSAALNKFIKGLFKEPHANKCTRKADEHSPTKHAPKTHAKTELENIRSKQCAAGQKGAPIFCHNPPHTVF